jgi:diamine N-acetyltransferase
MIGLIGPHGARTLSSRAVEGAMNRVTIHRVTRANWRDTLLLTVRPDQQRFIAGYAPIAAIILSKAYVAEGEMVGLAALAAEPRHTDQRWLFHFFIDERFQGRGYGRAALAALISWVREHHTSCQFLALTVHPENHVAQRLYIGMGFTPTGHERGGEPVYLLTLRERDE